MKEPFWIISRVSFIQSQISERKYNIHWSLFKLIYVWLSMQWFYFRSLYFKKCNDSKKHGLGHFLNGNGYCLRCKKSLRQLDIERRLMK